MDCPSRETTSNPLRSMFNAANLIDSRYCHTSMGTSASSRSTSVLECLGYRTRTGQRPDLHLGGLPLQMLLAGDGAEETQQERGRYRDEAGVAQREPGPVGVREHRGRRAGD